MDIKRRPALSKAFACTSLLTFSLSAGSALASITSLSNLFVFGDSFSDSGNAYQMSFQNIMPSPPYDGGRFTNGPVTVEYLWQNFNPGDDSFKPSQNGGTNYAVGGATSGRENYLSWYLWDQPFPTWTLAEFFSRTGNAWQLAKFKSAKPTFDPGTSLFAVWMFPNDIFTEFWPSNNFQGIGTYDGQPSPNGVDNIVPTAVRNVIGTVEELATEGARHFLVPNTPDLGKLPFFSANPNRDLATVLSHEFNARLDQQLAQLAAARPELDIISYRTQDFINAIMSNPSAYGISNAADACLDDTVSPAVVCATPETYLYWDSVHPTTTVQRLLSQRMYERVRIGGGAAVPAPIPALGGLAALGWSRSLRRRIRLHSQKTSRSCAGRSPAS
ncbi:MAG: SGNH/GDSL hydrolase family protein [Synechococcaceae cyanobacterium]|nr:SGNH/GDSL hydrolase family protein [Synechococcaceae cyanobacterium]